MSPRPTRMIAYSTRRFDPAPSRRPGWDQSGSFRAPITVPFPAPCTPWQTAHWVLYTTAPRAITTADAGSGFERVAAAESSCGLGERRRLADARRRHRNRPCAGRQRRQILGLE